MKQEDFNELQAKNPSPEAEIQFQSRQISHEEAGADYAIDTVSSLKGRIEKLKEAIRNVPTDEYNQAQDDGCDGCGAWDCFLEKLGEWEKQALML